MAVLGLCCCVGFTLVVVSWGYSLVGVRKLLIAVAFLVAEQAHAVGRWASVVVEYVLNNCGSRVQAQ